MLPVGSPEPMIPDAISGPIDGTNIRTAYAQRGHIAVQRTDATNRLISVEPLPQDTPAAATDGCRREWRRQPSMAQ